MNIKGHLIQVPDVKRVGVYAIHNTRNGKYYVGSSVNINSRMKSHRSNIESLKGCNLKMKSDLLGKENIADFEFLVLETFEDYELTEGELRKKEDEYICQYDAYNGYNEPNRKPCIGGYYTKNELIACRKPKTEKMGKREIEKMTNYELMARFQRMLVHDNDFDSLRFGWIRTEIIKRMDRGYIRLSEERNDN